jgi:F0F1-type ATP synthase assembly protein I
MAVLSYVIGGVLTYGGLGWLGWHFLHQLWMVPVGLVLGMGLSLLMVIRRYARADVLDAQIKELVAERDRQREHWTALARQSDSDRRDGV